MKQTLIFTLTLSLFFYCIIDELSANIIERFDKIETKIDKKEEKAKELFVKDNIDYHVLPYVVNENDFTLISLNSSFSCQRLARPPPF